MSMGPHRSMKSARRFEAIPTTPVGSFATSSDQEDGPSSKPRGGTGRQPSTAYSAVCCQPCARHLGAFATTYGQLPRTSEVFSVDMLPQSRTTRRPAWSVRVSSMPLHGTQSSINTDRDREKAGSVEQNPHKPDTESIPDALLGDLYDALHTHHHPWANRTDLRASLIRSDHALRALEDWLTSGKPLPSRWCANNDAAELSKRLAERPEWF